MSIYKNYWKPVFQLTITKTMYFSVDTECKIVKQFSALITISFHIKGCQADLNFFQIDLYFCPFHAFTFQETLK